MAVTILYMLPQKLVDAESADGTGTYRPAWFRTLLRDNPALVADVLRRSAARKLETGVQPAMELRELAEAEDHREVAALASLPVLESFPKAETTAALMALCRSLSAALANCDWSEVGQVIEERLGSARLASEERSCWLTAGFLVDPERYRENFRALETDEHGVKWLSRLVAVRFRVDFTRRLAARDVASLVVAMGAAFRLHDLTQEAYWSTSDVIATLDRDPSAAATAALEALSRVPDAEPWLPVTRQIRESQARKRREHEYRHGEFGQVVKTLDNQSPANVGDLAALVFDQLRDLSLNIRDGSTSDWRQYWNVGSPQPPDGAETRERVPGCGAVRSEGKASTVRNRCAAGRRLRRRQEVGHPRQLRRIQCSGGDQAKLPP